MKYFGEDNKKLKFEDFFQTWSTFLTSFNEIKSDNQKRTQALSKRKTFDALNTSINIRSSTIRIRNSDIFRRDALCVVTSKPKDIGNFQ